MQRAELESYAGTVPSMGGTELGPFLRETARNAPQKTSVVEVGTWLGAGTAQLALGILDRGEGNLLPIHCYDRWKAREQEVQKASRYNIQLKRGMNTLPVVKRTLAPFGVPICYHKTKLKYARWAGGPISVYVDDAAKDAQTFQYILYTFGPSWVVDSTVVVLMDFEYWKKTGDEKHKAQHYFMEEYASHFEKIDRSIFKQGAWHAFHYKKQIDFSRFKPSDLIYRHTLATLNALRYPS